MKFILSAHRSRLTKHQTLCVQLKVSKFSPNITELSKDKDLIKKRLFDYILSYPIKLIK